MDELLRIPLALDSHTPALVKGVGKMEYGTSRFAMRLLNKSTDSPADNIFQALPTSGSTETNLPALGASYSYDPAARKLISYDTPEIAQQKAQYILSKGLGGGMWWETSSDNSPTGPNSQRSLIKTVVDTWGGANSGKLDSGENTLEYPGSKYDNLRNGMN